MLSFKIGFLATAASAFLLAMPVAPASATPLGLSPAGLVRADAPIEQARYRKKTVRKKTARKRQRYYRRAYRYRVDPGVAMFGVMLGAMAAANAADNYY
ncbi:MAG: hypothetical protein ACK5JM_04190, partial [Rhodoblastus sp.]